MSSAVTNHREEFPSRDRRSWPREPLEKAVLVFFGENNWGKLIDLGESGMSFEFAQAPPLREPINFRFETMGCTPAHLGRQHFNDSFGLAGEVVWTRQFERAAGVRFLDLCETTREQIRNLLHSESTTSAATADEPINPEVLVPESEPTVFPVCPTEELVETKGERTADGAEAAESGVPIGQQLDPEQIQEILDAPTFEAYKKLQIDEVAQSRNFLGSKSSGARIGLIAVFASLAILSAVAVATRNPARWIRRAQAAEQVPSLPADRGRPVVPESRSVGTASQPFMVEVSDTNNEKWLLWFDHNLPKSRPESIARRPAVLSSPAEPKKKAIDRGQPSSAEKHDGLGDSKYFKPQLSRPVTKALAMHSSADALPVIPDVMAAPSLESTAGLLTPAEVPALIVRSASAGGKVQPARLLKSALPTYPPLAIAGHIGGNVVLDALIDADGSVRDVKVVSGPVLLQQAAINAVRQWKYEPARLDGRPVSMHVSVTVKFSAQ